MLRRFDEAVECHRSSLNIKREIGDRRGETLSLISLGDEAPSWDALRRRLTRAPFSPDGITAVGLAIDKAERMLGPSWPRRQFERKGWWPGEFNLLTSHAAALPQFLALVARLESAAREPTFETVLRGIKRGVTTADWRHALLQLEVNRALRRSGTAVTFEPEISGGQNRADLLVPSEDQPFLSKPPRLRVPISTWRGRRTNTRSGGR